MKYKAFLLGLNGTMVDDMAFHILAWHRVLNELGAAISLKRMKQECYGKNHEILERIFPGRYSREEKNRLSWEKEKDYRQAYRPHLKAAGGLEAFLKTARAARIPTAIGSAATMINVDFVLDGLELWKYIDIVISADDVIKSKPDPETWLRCAEKLKVSPKECLVFEDCPKGAESAVNAGMDCVILAGLYTREEFSCYKNMLEFIGDFQDASLKKYIG